MDRKAFFAINIPICCKKIIDCFSTNQSYLNREVKKLEENGYNIDEGSGSIVQKN